MFYAYLVEHEPEAPMPSTRKEVSMQQLAGWKSRQHEVSLLLADLHEQANELGTTGLSMIDTSPNVAVDALGRSRSRIRRRRRKRAWNILRIYLLLVVLVHGTLQGRRRCCR
jgi:hypothetical protein